MTLNELEKVIKEFVTQYVSDGAEDINDLGDYLKSIVEEANDEFIDKTLENILPTGTCVYLPELSWQCAEKHIEGEYTITGYEAEDDEPYESYYELTNKKHRTIFIQAPILMAVLNKRPLRGFVYVTYGENPYLTY